MEEQTRLDAIERRFDALIKRFEELAEQVRTISETKPQDLPARRARSESGRIFWGTAMVIVGLVWLGDRLSWFDVDIPVAASAFIIIGLYLIITSRSR